MARSSSTVHKKFTPEEDRKLVELVAINGPRKWSKIAQGMDGRTGRQCRDRFQNYLNPRIAVREWTAAEDQLLIQKVLEVGPRFKMLSPFFPDRSHNDVTNRIKHSAIATALKKIQSEGVGAKPVREEPCVAMRPAPEPVVKELPTPTRNVFEVTASELDLFSQYSVAEKDWLMEQTLTMNSDEFMKSIFPF